ncbi:DUF4179 domain-containing protein [Bacillus sp. JJ722]|uniref:DUF4179 domain-containing protein n=1 Tax=Bacillus sp. JJ722 TaxID=3122973 RepID=UPI0030003341
MNCPTIDKLSQYADQLLMNEEHIQIQRHVESCDDCCKVVEAFRNEQNFIKETLHTPSLPDDFAAGIIRQLEPYKQKTSNKKKAPWKNIMLYAAGVVLVIGLSTTLHPSFAKWIGGFFSSGEVDVGLKIANETDLKERVNLEAKNQGITFKVEDIITDSTRVALSYQIIDEQGNFKDTELGLGESNNEVYVTSQDGDKLEHVSTGTHWSEGSDYGLIEFSLRELETLDHLLVKFDLVELDGEKGTWKLEVPIDLTKSKALTKTLPFKNAITSQYGVNLKMNQMRFATSSNELSFETSFTDDELVKVNEQVAQLRRKLGSDDVVEEGMYGTAINYHIENENNQTVYQTNLAYGVGNNPPVDYGMLSESSEDLDELGHSKWYSSFIPKKDQQLTFVLDGVIKTVPSDFSIKIKTEDLKDKPVSFEYEGNHITITSAEMESDYSIRKSLKPIEKETFFQIKMEGGREATASDLGSWALVDHKGKAYSLNHSGSILNEKDQNGRFKLTSELRTSEMSEVPEEFTLHLLSVNRYYEVQEQWKLPLYEGK